MGSAVSVMRSRDVGALREFLPERAILHEEDTRPYECDGLTAYRQLPMVVARDCRAGPAGAQDLRFIEYPGRPRGAGTGLSGGALPPGDGVLLSMAKFMRVLRIDPLARVAVVQPGVRNAVVSELAAPYGLYYAPDPSSQIACTIGGNVSENPAACIA